MTAQLFEQATDAFEDSVAAHRISTSDFDFTTPVGWEKFSARIVSRYAQAHFGLISSDATYRQQIGGVMETHADLVWGKHPPRLTPAKRDRRYLNDGHEMIKVALQEGVATSVAVFEVVPFVVKESLPDMSTDEQLQASYNLLPSTSAFSQRLARHSKHGNDMIIKNVMDTTGVKPSIQIDYEHLHYDPRKFTLTALRSGRLALATVTDNRTMADLERPFTGCPAVNYGSVGRLNKLITTLVKTESIYTRSLT